MARHPYSTNSDERKLVPFLLAILAVFTSFALTFVYQWIHWEPPSALDAPGTLTLYGIYYWLFKKYWWKWKILRSVGIVTTPVLEGAWVGTVKTEYNKADAPTHEVEVVIGQDWTDILIRLSSPYSHSRSLSGSMTVNEDETALVYEYVSEPNPDAADTLHIHYGTTRLLLTNANTLQGEYYTGRGRLNIGTLTLRRRATESQSVDVKASSAKNTQ